MRKFIILLLALIAMNTYGYTSDSLKIVTLQREVSILKSTVSRLQQEDGRLRNLYQLQTKELDSLRANQQQQTENVKSLAEQVGADISDANQKIDSNVSTLSESINSRTWLGALGILIAIGLLACTYYILRKKISSGTSTIDKIRTAQEGLESAQKAMQEESVKLDSKLVELLDKKMEATPASVSNEQTDHTLALKVADEIVRIETNLSRMDTSVKGYKQLAKAVERIRANFLANGYEIVEMLGKPYNEGMKVVANFVSDETLAEGEQKITGIIKPQINYKGKMIQSAQITVSQNL
jgi:predicted  nucleic acid-binding Zn-ribbon protein